MQKGELITISRRSFKISIPITHFFIGICKLSVIDIQICNFPLQPLDALTDFIFESKASGRGIIGQICQKIEYAW